MADAKQLVDKLLEVKVKRVCSMCKKDMGEVEFGDIRPEFQNQPTHGVCADCKERMLARLRSGAFHRNESAENEPEEDDPDVYLNRLRGDKVCPGCGSKLLDRVLIPIDRRSAHRGFRCVRCGLRFVERHVRPRLEGIEDQDAPERYLKNLKKGHKCPKCGVTNPWNFMVQSVTRGKERLMCRCGHRFNAEDAAGPVLREGVEDQDAPEVYIHRLTRDMTCPKCSFVQQGRSIKLGKLRPLSPQETELLGFRQNVWTCDRCERYFEEPAGVKLEAKADDRKWIGVDLDGTLAHYTRWLGSTKIGKPIEPMAERVREWHKKGKKIKIFTARADDEKAVNAIKDWLKDNDLPDLEITNLKDEHMEELWDDRAVSVEKNKGKVVKADVDEALADPDEPDERHVQQFKKAIADLREIKTNAQGYLIWHYGVSEAGPEELAAIAQAASRAEVEQIVRDRTESLLDGNQISSQPGGLYAGDYRPFAEIQNFPKIGEAAEPDDVPEQHYLDWYSGSLAKPENPNWMKDRQACVWTYRSDRVYRTNTHAQTGTLVINQPERPLGDYGHTSDAMTRFLESIIRQASKYFKSLIFVTFLGEGHDEFQDAIWSLSRGTGGKGLIAVTTVTGAAIYASIMKPTTEALPVPEPPSDDVPDEYYLNQIENPLNKVIDAAVAHYDQVLDRRGIVDARRADELAADLGSEFAEKAGYANGTDEFDLIVSAVNNRAGELFPGDWEDYDDEGRIPKAESAGPNPNDLQEGTPVK